MLRRLLRLIRQAGARSESDSERDGFLSYHAESHSVGVGLGLGWLVIATDDFRLLGLIIPAITSGLRAKNREFGKILTDLKQEPHYTLGGLLVGVLFGLATRTLV